MAGEGYQVTSQVRQSEDSLLGLARFLSVLLALGIKLTSLDLVANVFIQQSISLATQIFSFLKNHIVGVGGMIQWFRAFDTPPEDLNLVPRTHIRQNCL